MFASFPCSVCGNEAGVVVVDRSEVRREGWPSVLTLPGAADDALRAAVAGRDVRALFAFHFELTPFYCPTCDASYCSDHWDWWVVWDEEWTIWRDSVRGRCPHGHERMLED